MRPATCHGSVEEANALQGSNRATHPSLTQAERFDGSERTSVEHERQTKLARGAPEPRDEARERHAGVAVAQRLQRRRQPVPHVMCRSLIEMSPLSPIEMSLMMAPPQRG